MSQERRLKDFVKAPEKVDEVAVPIVSVWVKVVAYNTAVVACKVTRGDKRTIFVHNRLFSNSGAFSLMRRVKNAKQINLQHWHK